MWTGRGRSDKKKNRGDVTIYRSGTEIQKLCKKVRVKERRRKEDRKGESETYRASFCLSRQRRTPEEP